MQQRLSTRGWARQHRERVGETDTPTWMEVYAGVQDPAPFAAVLASALRESQLPAEMMAARRIERFRSL